MKKRCLLSILFITIFLTANVFGTSISNILNANTYNNSIVFAAPKSKGSSGAASGFKSGSFSTPKNSAAKTSSSKSSSSSTSKTSAAKASGFKSGNFSKSKMPSSNLSKSDSVTKRADTKTSSYSTRKSYTAPDRFKSSHPSSLSERSTYYYYSSNNSNYEDSDSNYDDSDINYSDNEIQGTQSVLSEDQQISYEIVYETSAEHGAYMQTDAVKNAGSSNNDEAGGGSLAVGLIALVVFIFTSILLIGYAIKKAKKFINRK